MLKSGITSLHLPRPPHASLSCTCASTPPGHAPLRTRSPLPSSSPLTALAPFSCAVRRSNPHADLPLFVASMPTWTPSWYRSFPCLSPWVSYFFSGKASCATHHDRVQEFCWTSLQGSDRFKRFMVQECCFLGCRFGELSEGDAGVCGSDGLGRSAELPNGALGSVMQTIVLS